MATLQVGAVGVVIESEVRDQDGVVVDVSAFTLLELDLRKPDGTTITRTGQLTTDGTNGFVQYTTIAGDLDQPGQWRRQWRIAIPGWSGPAATESFNVAANIA